MPDPTEFVIIATFSMALGIFALTATARNLLGKRPGPAPAADPMPVDEGSPYQPPAQTGPPPGFPVERVPVWFYRPLETSELLCVRF